MLQNALVGAVALCLVSLSSTDALARSVRLPAGTVVTVTTTQLYDSSNTTAGQSVILTVAADVQVQGDVVIKAGSAAAGTIQDAQEAQMLGQGGQLSIALNSVQTIDGQSVPVTGSLSARGSDETAGTVVGAVFCPLFLLNQCVEATIAQGTQGRAILLSEVMVDVPY